MADLSAKKTNFISRTAAGVSTLLAAVDDLIALRMEYDALGYGPGSGSPFEIRDADFVGANAYLTAQEIADVYSSLDALKAVLLQGHLTNLNKLRA